MTRAQWLRDATDQLTHMGIETARLDAELILAHALGMARNPLLLDAGMPLATEDKAAADALLLKRLARVPLAHITGHRAFWTLELSVNRHTLVPRPDTETLMEAVLDHVPDRQLQLRILDLGTGSGALLLALLHEYPNAWGVGTDYSIDAIGIAQQNASRHGLQDRASFVCADWDKGLGAHADFDLIVSNPPYIPSAAIATLMPEVRNHDPAAALDGGSDGLAAYRHLAGATAFITRAQGMCVVEVGQGQAEAVTRLFRQQHWAFREAKADLAGTPRALVFQKP